MRAEVRRRMMELDDEGNPLSRSATAAELKPLLEKHLSPLYRAKAPRSRSMDSVPPKNRKPLPSAMTAGRQSRTVMRDVKIEADVEMDRDLQLRLQTSLTHRQKILKLYCQKWGPLNSY